MRLPRHQLQCQCCGLLFPAVNSNAKWCSNACNQHAFRQRRKAIGATAIQTQILNDDDLPAEWAAAAAKTQGLECRSWNGTNIQRRESDGYVNATAMCQANGKRWRDYSINERTQAYIAALAADAGIPATGLAESIKGGRPDLQGTWIHPRLAVDLARWISPAFAVWMDGWFLETLALPQSPPPRPQPQLPRLPPSGPAILIRAKTEREAFTALIEAKGLSMQGKIPSSPLWQMKTAAAASPISLASVMATTWRTPASANTCAYDCE
jgi:hypothetical protein